MTQHPATAPSMRTNQAFDLKLPPMPHTLSEILSIRSQVNPDIDRLIDVVQRDPAITANVLRRVNSAYYGLSRQISQVDKAITLLGFKEVCGLVLTAAVKQAFAYKGSADAQRVYEHIMQTSVGAASFARHLAYQLGLRIPETAFTSGLLFQLGRVVLLYSAPKGYTQLWIQYAAHEESSHLTAPSIVREQLIFNTNYTRLGKALAQHWALPEEISTVIAFHHAPGKVNKTHLRTLVHVVAAGIAASLEVFEPDTTDTSTPPALFALAELRNVETTELKEFVASKRDEVLEFTQAMMQE